MIHRLPLGLTALRAALAPVLLLLAWNGAPHWLFAPCLVMAFLSDVFDGIIARRLGVATPGLRRLDSLADSLFYLCALAVAWQQHPSALRSRMAPLALLLSLELLRYGFDLVKFRREASYHMWSSKLWGIALFAGFLALLAWDADSGWVSAAVWLGILADLEGLAISWALPVWRSDVPSLWHALRIARSAA